MEIIVRATVIYFFLWAVTRGVGKRELSEMTAFELILLVTMGDLIQQGATQEDMSLTGAVLAVGTLALWILVFAYLSWRFKGAQRALEGVPVIVVRDGRPLDDVLKIERLTLDEVREEARNQGITDLADIDLAVLEPDGKFSFMKMSGGNGDQQGSQEKHRA
ncbi:MAG TPA: YetF domain-containing protein [Acidimicrobiales bacterium]|nr:YetF domain-containing protein [Acidimicrobiales bacterium]